MKLPIVVVLAALALSGCATAGIPRLSDAIPAGSAEQTDDEAVGGIVGGGLIMGEIGADLPRRARVAAIDAEYRALESTPAGQEVAWSDERSGRSGTVTAAQPYRVGSQDCRPYRHVINVAGASRSARGTACRNPDGSWTLLD